MVLRNPSMVIAAYLPWVDSLGGLTAGALVLLCQGLLVKWHNLPSEVIALVGFANLGYGSFSLLIALRLTRTLRTVQVLAIANMIWGPVCVGILLWHLSSIQWPGVVQLLCEGTYVSGLGVIEWRLRQQIAAPWNRNVAGDCAARVDSDGG